MKRFLLLLFLAMAQMVNAAESPTAEKVQSTYYIYIVWGHIEKDYNDYLRKIAAKNPANKAAIIPLTCFSHSMAKIPKGYEIKNWPQCKGGNW